MLAVEFMHYPDFLIRDLHIPSITMRSNLKLNSEDVGGFAITNDHSISLDVPDTLWDKLENMDWQAEFRDTLHHELYHLMDPIFQEGQIAVETYANWVNLNPKGIMAYGNQPINSQERPIGFARAYGTKNPQEDRATVFEALMTGVDFSTNDTVLTQKVASIRQQVFHLSHGLMDVQALSHTVAMRMRMISRNYNRLALCGMEPLFATVTDEEYSSWQRHYTDILRKHDEEDARRHTSGGDIFLDR